jgi:hypothetical protein
MTNGKVAGNIGFKMYPLKIVYTVYKTTYTEHVPSEISGKWLVVVYVWHGLKRKRPVSWV